MVYNLSPKDKILQKGPWLEEEDERLVMFVTLLGERRWDSLAKVSGLKRSGKNRRLRWLNSLRPNLKHGQITDFMHNGVTNLPGRTDNEIKNYCRTRLRKKALVQEQEKFRNEQVGDEKIFLQPGCDNDTRFQKHDPDGSRQVNDEIVETENHTDGDAHEIENFAIVSSPYETQISDWTSELSADQNESKYHDYGSSSGIGDSFPSLLGIEEY